MSTHRNLKEEMNMDVPHPLNKGYKLVKSLYGFQLG